MHPWSTTGGRRPGGRPTVAFTSTVAHAQALAGAFPAKSIRAAVVHGGMAAAERQPVLGTYDRGQIQVPTNCFVLGEGWDSPPTSCVLLLRPPIPGATQAGPRPTARSSTSVSGPSRTARSSNR